MENEHPPDDLRRLWQGQNVEGTRMSLEEIRQKAAKFQKRIRNRNLREYGAAAVVFGWFGYYVWWFPDVRLGSALILAATVYMVWQLHARGASKTVPEAMAVTPCVEFHRRELERQRDLLRDIWRWYLLPFVPGLAVFVWGSARHVEGGRWVNALPFLVLCVVFFGFVGRVNRRAADRLQRQIDELQGITG